VLLRRRAPWAYVLGAVAAVGIGGLIVWLVQTTLSRAGGLSTSLEGAGIAPIVMITVVSITMPLTIIGLMLLRPAPVEVTQLAGEGLHVTTAGGRTWVEWADVECVDEVSGTVCVHRRGGALVEVSAPLEEGERAWLMDLLRARAAI